MSLCLPSHSPTLFPLFLPGSSTTGTRETAFIQAVMAAGLVHAVTRSCSQGNMTECGCAGRPEGRSGVGAAPLTTEQEEGAGWHWGGCSDQIQYGTWFSRRFLDGEGGNGSIAGESMMSRHNSEAGRQVRQTVTHPPDFDITLNHMEPDQNLQECRTNQHGTAILSRTTKNHS